MLCYLRRLGVAADPGAFPIEKATHAMADSQEQNSSLPRNEAALIEPKSSREDPVRIATLLNSRAVGDTIFYHVYAASVKLLFDHAELMLYQRDDRPYKEDLLTLNPHKSKWLVLGPTAPGISIDNFTVINDLVANDDEIPDYYCRNEGWGGRSWHKPDIVLAPTNMLETNLASFDNPAFLSVPDQLAGRLTDELIAHGVDPNRWFCCLNYREPGYQYRPDRTLRDLNPRPFQELTDHIIDEWGGQVIRLGHPKMTPFRKRPGFIDLSRLENKFLLHAFAVSRARFMVGSLTGISHIGSALNTPTIITNNSDPLYFPGCWLAQDMALYFNMYRPNGKRISIEEQHENGFHHRNFLVHLINSEGFKIYQNNTAQLVTATDLMMQQTDNCLGWREPTPQPDGKPRPNSYVWPRERKIKPQILDLAHLG